MPGSPRIPSPSVIGRLRRLLGRPAKKRAASRSARDSKMTAAQKKRRLDSQIIASIITAVSTLIVAVLGLPSVLDWVDSRLRMLAQPTVQSTPTTAPTTAPAPETIALLAMTVEPTPTETLPPPTPDASPTPEQINTKQRAADGMTVIRIPATMFTMGEDPQVSLAECRKYRNDCDISWYVDEDPLHRVSLSEFWIDRTEVTNEMYARFLAAAGNRIDHGSAWLDLEGARISNRSGTWTVQEGYERHPVINVTWFGAREYCAWAGARLPTEAEWELAARGQDGRIYPWGNGDATCQLSNYTPCVGDTQPADYYLGGASPYGLLNMAGNVWEWIGDWYEDHYYFGLPDLVQDPAGPPQGESRVLRSGAWDFPADRLHSSYRARHDPADATTNIGFRCVSNSIP